MHDFLVRDSYDVAPLEFLGGVLCDCAAMGFDELMAFSLGLTDSP